MTPSLLPWQHGQWQPIGAAIVRQRIPHALLLIGAQGIGKRHFLAVLAQALLCHQPLTSGLPCGNCQSCRLVQAGTHPDAFRLERAPDSKVLKVDDLRDFNRKVFLTPQLGMGLVGIIDPVDHLNRSAANALLKSLEEPPAGAHILLIGERWHSLPATLRSRCLTLRFSSPDAEQVRTWLSQQPATSNSQSLRNRYLPQVERGREWASALANVCTGQQDPIQLAERWQKLDETLPELLEWLYSWTSDLIKIKTDVSKAFLAHPATLAELQATAARLPARSLHKLAGLGIETRKLLESQAKPQMLLEYLLASWYQTSTRTLSAPGRAVK